MKREKVKTGILRQRPRTRIALKERVVDSLSDIPTRHASHIISEELRNRGVWVCGEHVAPYSTQTVSAHTGVDEPQKRQGIK